MYYLKLDIYYKYLFFLDLTDCLICLIKVENIPDHLNCFISNNAALIFINLPDMHSSV